MEQLLFDISNSAMVQHSRIAEGVVRVKYENGSCVLINYNEEAVSVDGNTIAGMDYCVLN